MVGVRAPAGQTRVVRIGDVQSLNTRATAPGADGLAATSPSEHMKRMGQVEDMEEVPWPGEELPLGPPRRQSRADWVATVIENRILDDDIQAGTRLGTRSALRDALNVAPSTIAEAIKLLTERGLVATRTGPGGGVFVTEMGLTVRLARTMMELSGGHGEVADALEVRDLLEPAIIVGAAKAQPSDLGALRDSMAALDAADDVSDFYHRNLEFHLEIARLTRNDVLRSVYSATIELVRERRPRLRTLPGINQLVLHRERVEAHRSILEAIEAGDVALARRAYEMHSRRGEAHVVRDAHR